MRLEDLVPQLELCKQLKPGEFEDSALVHAMRFYTLGYERVVMLRDNALDRDNLRVLAPAPTLAEIMAAMPACTCYRLGKTWTVALCNDTLDNGIKSRRAATAALRLYLEVRE